ncbi:unnamed protein product [Spirodela intermedia]|uniref:Uncharacterized protein n=1 Tax=Spirodela intermedia TaxID=51605 RepID=A0A7I8IG50_SPIIN|nr:unnamed protein product [Spirodela intermedia]CAA6656848.1 unnamed protein product [Spirodela intermedia]
MDASGSTYKLLLSCPSGLSPSQVYVDFSASYDRIPHPAGNLENSIPEIWCQRIQENPSMYNDQKFRYAGYSSKNPDGSRSNYSICLNLGLTDYRTFVGTNLNPLWENFLVPSEDDTIHCQHMASPLGNGAIVETLDKRIIVLQRSSKVGEFPGYFVFPGGHSEPKEIGISGHPTDAVSAGSEHLNKKVATDPLFIGISRRELNVRPTAFFFLRCNVHSSAVKEFYSKAQDGFESTQLFAMSRAEIESMCSRIPGCHRGGFALYEQMAALEDA